MQLTEPKHPPYNITQPRQLVKWLDVNSQNGQLTRCRYNIYIPTFNIVNPNQFIFTSDIIGTFAYSCPNSFSLLDLSKLPTGNPGYKITIAYQTSAGVFRYFLAGQQVGTLPLLMQLPQYNGQLIKPNFRIEIWSDGANATLTSSIVLPTSVMQNVDYRYGADTALATAGALNTIFLAPLGPNTIPLNTHTAVPFNFT